MLDIFKPVPPEARREVRDKYQQFLIERDGVVDVVGRTLSRREEGMIRYEQPLAKVREIDRKLFRSQYAAFSTKMRTPSEMLLLLALLKINAVESFGVTKIYDTVAQRASKTRDLLELTLLIEETYHTRILLSSSVLYGIEVKAPFNPPALLRALVGGVAYSPEFMSRPLTLTSEILGALLGLSLLAKCREVLRHDTELCDSVEERICEITADEIGHVCFNRLCLGSVGLAQARLLVPMVAKGLSQAVPELAALGVSVSPTEGNIMSLATGEGLPEQIRKAAFLPRIGSMGERTARQ